MNEFLGPFFIPLRERKIRRNAGGGTRRVYVWATRGGREAANLPLNWNSQTRKPQPLQKVQTLLGTAVKIFFFLVKCEQWLFFPLNFLCPTVQAKFLMLKPYVMSLQTKIRRVASLVLASVDGEWQGTAV